ncbi:GNAT family N-acetyltransferase [Georgenia sp. SYP-B2076]|uniref:GNAT family N-acetyltransferase n=1 Tax=Georgenia sp. SYP-B2076 TaxID=2495881 RepID=UPI001F0C5160|nr:GNAT family N-acetyltransferase [Georgenia sp. SYP-B2076]
MSQHSPVQVARPPAALHFRLVRPEEHDAVGELLLAAYDEYGMGGAYRAHLRDVAGRVAEQEVWVALDDGGTIVGTVVTPREGRTLTPLARAGELDFRFLAVSPAARGRGVGSALTRHVLDVARRRGASAVVMNSGPQMLGAHALYLGLGFVRLPERETVVVADGRLLAFGYALVDHPAEPARDAGPLDA